MSNRICSLDGEHEPFSTEKPGLGLAKDCGFHNRTFQTLSLSFFKIIFFLISSIFTTEVIFLSASFLYRWWNYIYVFLGTLLHSTTAPLKLGGYDVPA
jgi:hypothetical protein